MTIQMSKFNTVLNGRVAAKEAALRIQQIVNGSAEREDVVLDFARVEVLAPSYADELLNSLEAKYGPSKVRVVSATGEVSEALEVIRSTSQRYLGPVLRY